MIERQMDSFITMLSIYSSEAQNGTSVDVEGLVVDFISFLKAFGQMEGLTKAQIMERLSITWDLLEVTIQIPGSAKQ